MICVRSTKKKDPKKMLTPAIDQTGSQVNFYYGAHAPYAESIAPSHHSTYAHYYDDDEEDGWEMPNFYNETYMKEGMPILYDKYPLLHVFLFKCILFSS